MPWLMSVFRPQGQPRYVGWKGDLVLSDSDIARYQFCRSYRHTDPCVCGTSTVVSSGPGEVTEQVMAPWTESHEDLVHAAQAARRNTWPRPSHIISGGSDFVATAKACSGSRSAITARPRREWPLRPGFLTGYSTWYVLYGCLPQVSAVLLAEPLFGKIVPCLTSQNVTSRSCRDGVISHVSTTAPAIGEPQARQRPNTC